MNSLLEAAKEVQDFLTEKGWRFCIIGGLAVIRWGEPRLTLDVDLTLLTGFGEEESYASALLSRFKPRREAALEFALKYRVLLFRTDNGTDIDVSFGAFPFEEDMIRRATPFLFAPDVELITCSAEDLFVLKAFAARPKDWMDAETVFTRQKRHLDTAYILKMLGPLSELKEAPDIFLRARKIMGV